MAPRPARGVSSPRAPDWWSSRTGQPRFAGDGDAARDEIETFLGGARTVPAADRVLATVLFVDLVGSTSRAAALGDGPWRRSLDAFHGHSRSQAERHRGHLVKTLGDGAVAIFDGPARAVYAASGMRRLAAELGMETRIGVHTGEIELSHDDIAGIGVHIAARVQAARAGRDSGLTDREGSRRRLGALLSGLRHPYADPNILVGDEWAAMSLYGLRRSVGWRQIPWLRNGKTYDVVLVVAGANFDPVSFPGQIGISEREDGTGEGSISLDWLRFGTTLR